MNHSREWRRLVILGVIALLVWGILTLVLANLPQREERLEVPGYYPVTTTSLK